jgi:hypothetical protein
MNGYWQRLITKTTFWVAVELLLNVTGLDNLADYSEFVFEKHINPFAHPVLTQSMPYPSHTLSTL